ncbi:contractile injection system protein, VgrG/Pvc8 family [Serratia plymuthica]|uniref:contractile injection system protein, VgrG/Pvc8 family n=1 Tax=Serratia plymuthica TaxID=82996 RepID=UPI0009BE30D4
MSASTHHGANYPLLILCARSADFRGSLNTRRDESYHDASLSDIVQKVAARNKLNGTQAAGLDPIKVSHIDQTQETDVAFITRLVSLNTASHKEQSGITLGLTRSLRKQVFLCLPNGCRHFVAISETGPCRRVRFVRAEDFRQQKTR